MLLNRAPQVPDYFDETSLASHLALRLGRTSQNDKSSDSQSLVPAVIWVDRGDEVLVHLNSIRIQIRDGMLLISIVLETDQRGRTPMVVALALGGVNDPAGLVAVVDELPHGDGVIASRWGKTLQEALWASLTGLALDHAKERSSAPHGFSASWGRLQLHAGEAPSATSSTGIRK